MSGHTPGPLESAETLVIPVPAIKVLLELLQTVRMIEETAHMLLLKGETINHPPLEGKADCCAVPIEDVKNLHELLAWAKKAIFKAGGK